jgi:hypothetical protein
MKSPTPAFLVLITFATTWMLALLTTGQLFGTGEDSPLKVERKAVARVVKNKCVLPHWVEAGSQVMADEIVNGSLGLTDKVRHRHDYEFMYYPYMSTMIRSRYCASPTDTSASGSNNDENDNGTQPVTVPAKITMLEIGLGRAIDGGMEQGTPGGSALAWRHLFGDTRNLELHIMEFDGACALKWAANHTHIAHVHVGDASSPEDLDRVVQAAGGGRRSILLVDDASHINWHQIKHLEHMISKVKPGGFYVVEDIHSACLSWVANTGASTKDEVRVGGTRNCMTTSDGQPTIFSKVVDWQKQLLVKAEPFQGVNHIDVHKEAVVFEKRIGNY